MREEFVHLKLHTEYSLLEGVGKIEEYLDRAKKLDIKQLAVTDTAMFGVVEFYEKAFKKGIKPIIGLEIFMDGFFSEGEYSLTLLARNQTGYKNLCKLSSLSFSRFNRSRNKIRYEELKKHSEGLFILSGGINSELTESILTYKYSEFKNIITKLVQDFGEYFYVEVPAAERLKDKVKLYIEMAEECNAEYVAANDVYYANFGDSILQKIMISIKDGTKINSENTELKYNDLYLKSAEQMKENFSGYEKAIENSVKIARECNVSFEFDKFKFPEYNLPEGKSETEYIRELVYDGLKKKYGEPLEEKITERAEYELDIINKMGYNGYFIIVWDFIKYAKDNGIYVGPGRGSSAGSIVSYALNITEVDPIKYNLIFERFLNPERISMPDIDIDFDQEQREQVIDYVVKKYGHEKVAHIITFGTLKARAAIRDVGRVLDINLKKVDKVAKLIPHFSELEDAVKNVRELKTLYNSDSEVRDMIDYSLKLEGKVRHASVHAAGMVISKDVLDDEIPTYSDGRASFLSTQYQMKELEDLGILKMDFLGLKNLTILRKTMENIKITQGKVMVLDDIPLDDKETYKMLTAGDTLGVFQCESIGIRRLMQKMKIEKFEDIVALLALYRPGPLRSGMVDDFIASKNEGAAIKYPHEALIDVLSETYGVILYQEQVLKIVNVLANYTMGEGDSLRRAMGKKIPELMAQNREVFIKRAVENNITPDKAEEIFNLIDKFSGYGFPKSHSVAYALVAYWTAYLKTNYFKEFFAATMSTEMYNIDRLSLFINEARDKGVKVLLPDVNLSAYEFLAEKDGIRFGLLAIKHVGINIVKKVIEVRKNEKFDSYEDFVYNLKKEGLNKKQLEAFVFSGSLDKIHNNRKEMFSSIDRVLEWCEKKFNSEEDLQMILFGGKSQKIGLFSMEKSEEYSESLLLEKEKEFLGVYLSKHPLDNYKLLMRTIDKTRMDSLKQGKRARVIGLVKDIKKMITKKTGEPMARFFVEDYGTKAEVVCFPRDYINYSHEIFDGNAVIVEGTVSSDNSGRLNIHMTNISSLKDIDENHRLKLYILIDEETKGQMVQVKKVITENKGPNQVYFAVNEAGKKEIIKLSEKYRVSITAKFIEELSQLFSYKKIKIK